YQQAIDLADAISIVDHGQAEWRRHLEVLIDQGDTASTAGSMDAGTVSGP
ncbi:MAG: hypothetical protein GY773_25035, partial [Actinomycetia bacterium]|nr:hypothetical protein [Actinomycetes bacterium]